MGRASDVTEDFASALDFRADAGLVRRGRRVARPRSLNPSKIYEHLPSSHC